MNSKEISHHDTAKVAKFLTTDPAEIDKKVNQPIRELLHKYSQIPQDKIVDHVVKLVCLVFLMAFSFLSLFILFCIQKKKIHLTSISTLCDHVTFI